MIYKIREIAVTDNLSVSTIIKNVMTEFGASGAGFSINDAEVGLMYESYTKPMHAYFVVTSAQGTHGGGGIAPLTGSTREGTDETICELRKMYFLPEVRNLGIGQALMDKCLVRARELGFKKCYLETLTSMVGAEKLYLRNGFRPIEKPLGNTGHFNCDRFYLKDLF